MTTTRAERRLAAILVADIVGYSRMMGADETGTLRRLKLLRRELIDPQIAAARGRIVKTMGDGLLVEFPSPVRAVTCAVRIQQAMPAREPQLPPEKQFRLRFGINVGDVVAEPDGDLYGDGVNVAARLEPLAEPGGLCVSRSVHDQVRDKLPYRFEDRGKLELKNIARPIGVFALSAASVAALAEPDAEEDEAEDEAEAEDPPDPVPRPVTVAPQPARSRWRGGLIAAGVAGVTVLAAAGGLGLRSWPAQERSAIDTSPVSPGGAPKTVPGLSLVVLPFANLSSDPEQDYFADGLTEDLTTDLSHLAGSFVIARNTAFTYKGKAVDVKQVGRDLGVRYALEGSVRRTGEHVVLNAQLISTETGSHIWADRFEGERGRLGELQVEFVARLARSLDLQLTQAESLRALRERPNNPTAADLTMRGWATLNKPRSKAVVEEAISLFEQALDLDPDAPQALMGLSRSLMHRVGGGWTNDKPRDIEKAERLIRKVLAESQENPMALYIKGDVFRAKQAFDDALAMYNAAIEADRNFAIAYASAGVTNILSGRAKDARPLVAKALRLSPRDPLLNIWKYYMCHSYTHEAKWEEAITWCNRSLADGPFWQAVIDLAAAYAWLGNEAAARASVNQLLELMPGYTVQRWANAGWSSNPTFLVEYQRIIEGLRKAGLPEGEVRPN